MSKQVSSAAMKAWLADEGPTPELGKAVALASFHSLGVSDDGTSLGLQCFDDAGAAITVTIPTDLTSVIINALAKGLRVGSGMIEAAGKPAVKRESTVTFPKAFSLPPSDASFDGVLLALDPSANDAQVFGFTIQAAEQLGSALTSGAQHKRASRRRLIRPV